MLRKQEPTAKKSVAETRLRDMQGTAAQKPPLEGFWSPMTAAGAIHQRSARRIEANIVKVLGP